MSAIWAPLWEAHQHAVACMDRWCLKFLQRLEALTGKDHHSRWGRSLVELELPWAAFFASSSAISLPGTSI